ncbi:MAG TPA: hypothetical protein VGF07_02000 [Stellaceae bacterium]|jgi:hypothetical protein
MLRQIPLKIVEFSGPTGQKLPDLHYSEALVVIAKAPQGGLAGDEIDTALAIEAAVSSAVDAGRDAVLLDDAQWGWLAERVRQNRWPFASAVFKALIADVVEAAPFDPNRKPAALAAE